MTPADRPTIHASAVRVGSHFGVLIRGPSGAGKSRLAFDLVLAGRAGQIPPTLLVGDDRILVAREGDAVIARPAPSLAGLIEIRGLGIRQCPFAPETPVGLIVDLDAPDAERLPEPDALQGTVEGIILPRIPVGAGHTPLPLVLASLITTPGPVADGLRLHDCLKGFGNHISPTIATG
ncbi:MAG: HPr kinase/phosphatase C-terminal domain-containing protein [Xanthobacteraceae bacterium]|nr:HPr kinase/phosphatase C-terminal domain-containing protein [Xanthobacteraceae bacterium]